MGVSEHLLLLPGSLANLETFLAGSFPHHEFNIFSSTPGAFASHAWFSQPGFLSLFYGYKYPSHPISSHILFFPQPSLATQPSCFLSYLRLGEGERDTFINNRRHITKFIRQAIKSARSLIFLALATSFLPVPEKDGADKLVCYPSSPTQSSLHRHLRFAEPRWHPRTLHQSSSIAISKSNLLLLENFHITDTCPRTPLAVWSCRYQEVSTFFLCLPIFLNPSSMILGLGVFASSGSCAPSRSRSSSLSHGLFPGLSRGRKLS